MLVIKNKFFYFVFYFVIGFEFRNIEFLVNRLKVREILNLIDKY